MITIKYKDLLFFPLFTLAVVGYIHFFIGTDTLINIYQSKFWTGFFSGLQDFQKADLTQPVIHRTGMAIGVILRGMLMVATACFIFRMFMYYLYEVRK